MVIIDGTTNDFKIFFLTHTFFTIYVVKNSRIIPVFGIVSEFVMRSDWNPQMLKDTDQIMTSRFANVDSIAAIANITIWEMRTCIMGNLIFEPKEIFQAIFTFENYLNSSCRKIFGCKPIEFAFEFKWLLTKKW